MRQGKQVLLLIIAGLLLMNCAETKEQKKENDQQKTVAKQKKNTTITLMVTATAYNSIESQTKKGNIGLSAWGDTLKPGVHAIAVSRDLIKMGLEHNQEVEINGLADTYIVKDKMNKRWKKRIDIYMGLDIEAAHQWGRKKVEIRFDTTQKPQEAIPKQVKDLQKKP